MNDLMVVTNFKSEVETCRLELLQAAYDQEKKDIEDGKCWVQIDQKNEFIMKWQDRELKKEEMVKRFVYIVKNNDYYKIGRTTKPMERIKSFTGFPGYCRVITCTEVDNNVKVENELHKMFYKNRFTGEWFKLNDDELSQALKYIKANRINL